MNYFAFEYGQCDVDVQLNTHLEQKNPINSKREGCLK
jgi:hypothetical protein